MEHISNINIDIESIEDVLYDSRGYIDPDIEDNMRFIIEMYHDGGEDQAAIERFIGRMNQAVGRVQDIVSSKVQNVDNVYVDNVYVDETELIKRFFNFISVPSSPSGFFPLVIYVTGNKREKASIGLQVFEDGDIEMFEGNEMANNDTYEIVNEILGRTQKVRVYGSHGKDVIDHIKRTGTLPNDLYVSTDKRRASGYFGGDRFLFTGIVDFSKLREESDVDFKTIGTPKIEQFKLI